MKRLLAYAHCVDWLTDRFGSIAAWAVFASCVISSANALFRYTFSNSSNAFLEIQWYLFAAGVMFGASQVMRMNEHVRVDVIYGRISSKAKVCIDLFGIVFLMLPVLLLLVYFSWPQFVMMFASGETSANAGGLIRWPAMLTLPLGFGLLILQATGETIKRVAWLRGTYQMDTHYDRPLQ